MLTTGILASARRRAPVVLAETLVTGLTVNPLVRSHTVAAGTDCFVAVGGWTINSTLTITAITYGGQNMTLAAQADDTNATDRAHCYCYFITKAGGLLTGAQDLSVTLSGNPGEQSWYLADLQGANQTNPVVDDGVSTTAGTEAKSVTVDTSASGQNTLVLGGRVMGRGDRTPFTPGTDVTEVIDDLNSAILSFFAGRRLDMAPQSFAFACTSNGVLDGDAMGAVAFKG